MRDIKYPAARDQRPSLFWPLAIVASTVAICALTFGDVESPARTAIGLWFVLVCPGLALVRLVRIPGLIAEWTLAIALSIALDSAVSTVMVYTGNWSPKTGLAALAGITLVGALLQIKPGPIRPSIPSGRQILP